MDATAISTIALIVTVLMSGFSIYTWHKKATHDEVGELRQRVEQLERELEMKTKMINERDHRIFGLMTELHTRHGLMSQ